MVNRPGRLKLVNMIGLCVGGARQERKVTLLDRVNYDGGQLSSAQLDLRRQEEFARANRHSRRVRMLRRAIPIGCGLALLLPTLFVFFNPFKALDVNVSVGRITISGSKITMEAPKLTGYKKDNRAYVVNARSAAQDPHKPNLVELNDMIANIEMPNNGWAKVEAVFGLYDSQAEKIDLKTNVHVRTDTGYDVKTSEAMIEFKDGHVVVNQPVNVIMNTGTIDADSMEIIDNGKEITFTGHVVSNFQGKPDDAPATTDQDKKQP